MTARLAALLVCTMWSAHLTAGPALSEGSQAQTTEQEKLEAVEKELDRTRSRSGTLQKELEELERETAQITTKLVDLATRIQSREAMITASETRITTLSAQESRLKARLSEQRSALSELLAGLQTLERNPPPPLAARPDDAVAAIRGAMLFGAVVPALRAQTTTLAQTLARIDNVRARLVHEYEEMKDHTARLNESRVKLAALHKRKLELVGRTNDELQELKERSARLARQSKTLKALLAALEIERKRRAEREAIRATQQKQREAIRNSKPKIVFAKAKGRLDYPAQGQKIRKYGAKDGFGGHTKGLFIATRNKAQVTAPSDGKVEFSGTFRSYGQLLILDVGAGYHVLLAGLGQITVRTGQDVRAGEPVGVMGENPARGTLIGDQLDDPRPILYVEFRRNGASIDPTPWWVGNRKEARR